MLQNISLLVDAGHGLYQSNDGLWTYQGDEWWKVREDLVTPYLAKNVNEILLKEVGEVWTTRPFPDTPEGDRVGVSRCVAWKEGALYAMRDRMESHPLYRELGTSNRGKDTRIRPWYANFLEVTAAMSIHTNGDKNADAHGVEVWHRHGDPRSKKFAQIVYEELTVDPRFDGQRGIKGQNGSDWERTHALGLRWFADMNGEIPVILIEFLFHTNRQDNSLLKQPAVLASAAEYIGKGFMRFCREVL